MHACMQGGDDDALELIKPLTISYYAVDFPRMFDMLQLRLYHMKRMLKVCVNTRVCGHVRAPVWPPAWRYLERSLSSFLLCAQDELDSKEPLAKYVCQTDYCAKEYDSLEASAEKCVEGCSGGVPGNIGRGSVWQCVSLICSASLAVSPSALTCSAFLSVLAFSVFSLLFQAQWLVKGDEMSCDMCGGKLLPVLASGQTGDDLARRERRAVSLEQRLQGDRGGRRQALLPFRRDLSSPVTLAMHRRACARATHMHMHACR